jgi:hypothetical protein
MCASASGTNALIRISERLLYALRAWVKHSGEILGDCSHDLAIDDISSWTSGVVRPGRDCCSTYQGSRKYQFFIFHVNLWPEPIRS